MSFTTRGVGLLSLGFLIGCGGGSDALPAGGPANAPPPAVVSESPDPADAGGAAAPAAEIIQAAAPPAGAPANDAAALAIVHSDSFGVIKLNVAQLRNSPLLQSLPIEPDVLARQATGFGPDARFVAELLPELDLLCVSVGPPEVGVAAYVRFTTPEALRRVASMMEEQFEPAEHQGVGYFKHRHMEGGPTYRILSDRELQLASQEAVIHQLIAAQGDLAAGPLQKRLASVNLEAPILLAGSLGYLREMATDELQQLAEGTTLESLASLPAQIDWVALTVDPDGARMIGLEVEMQTVEGAEQLLAAAEGLLAPLKAQEGEATAPGEDGAAGEMMLGVARDIANAVTVARTDLRVELALVRPTEFDRLLERTHQALAVMREENQRLEQLNNARHVSIAMFNFRDTYRSFPPRNVTAEFPRGDEGEPLLSWRVAILPYVEEYRLSEDIRYGEAWDSEHNRQFLERMPNVFATEGSEGANTTTWKYVPDAPGDIWMIAAGKGTAVPWLQPDVLTIDPQDPLAALGEAPAEGFIVCYRDGRVRRLAPEQLRAAWSGGAPAAPAPDSPATSAAPRVWRDATGNFSIEATLVTADADSVTLRRSDTNQEVTIPRNKLSEADRLFLARLDAED